MAQTSGGLAPAPSQSLLTEWATSLCHHLQQHRPSAPLSPVLPRVLAPAVERHLRQLIDAATKVQRRAKRATLSVDDVNFALALSRQEVSYHGGVLCTALGCVKHTGGCALSGWVVLNHGRFGRGWEYPRRIAET
jgi:hypothetical protein